MANSSDGVDQAEQIPPITDEKLSKLADDASYWGPQVYEKPGLAIELAAELRASLAREQKLIETDRELRQQLISWIADYGALEAKRDVLQQHLDDRTYLYNREVLINTLVYHYRKDISGCGCGWAYLGASHPEHIADLYEESVRALND